MAESSRVEVKTVHVQWPDGREALLLDFTIECTGCGGVQFRLAGEHVASVMAALEQAQTKYPALCGRVLAVEKKVEITTTPELARNARLN